MERANRGRPRSIYVRSAASLTACLGAIALIATAYWLSEIRLPHPAVADREELMRWLVLRDLQKEPPEIRFTLVSRLQEEVQRNFEPASLQSRLDPSYRDRVWANVLVLIETWYSANVDRYFESSPDQRPACLDRAIEEVTQWKGLAALRPGSPSADSETGSDAAVIELFAEQVNRWKEQASPQRRRQITQFDTALRARWLLHALGLAP